MGQSSNNFLKLEKKEKSRTERPEDEKLRY